MLFNSYEFIYVFFPVVFSLYWLLVRKSNYYGRVLLSIASLIFYSFLSIEYLPLLLFSIVTNFLIGSRINTRRSKLFLILGISFNLGNIIFFKYFDLVFVNTLGLGLPQFNSIIPLGISFYTFTQIAYIIDTFNNKSSNDHTFVSYILFVTYFPHLVAGPILHHKNMLDQFSDRSRYSINYENITEGIIFFLIGLAKKVLIADTLAGYASPVFDGVAGGSHIYPLEAWVAALAYTFQLYFDFSGYSDMAIGLSKFFNFNLPINFDSPYKSLNIIDFWRRWHISLSSFLRDYLYIPLGGNRNGNTRRYMNLLLTMVIGGAWHGANWTFFLWGGYHGCLLAINNYMKKNLSFITLPTFVLKVFTFILVVLGWVIFRSDSIGSAFVYLSSLFNYSELLVLPHGWEGSLQHLNLSVPFAKMIFFQGKFVIFMIIALYAGCLIFPNSQKIAEGFITQIVTPKYRFARLTFGVTTTVVLFFVCLYFVDKKSEFIYFQF